MSDILNVLGVLDVVDCEVILEYLLSVQSKLTQILHQHTHLERQQGHIHYMGLLLEHYYYANMYQRSHHRQRIELHA